MSPPLITSGSPRSWRSGLCCGSLLLLVLNAATPAVARPDGGDDEDSGHQIATRVVETGTGRAVRLEAALQQQSGIVIERLSGARMADEFVADGVVLDINPLLDSYYEIQEARAGREAARADARNSQAALDRLQEVKDRGGDVPVRQLLGARAQRDADRSRLDSSDVHLQRLVQQVRGKWGPHFAALVETDSNTSLAPFLDAEETVLLVVLPGDQRMPGAKPGIRVASGTERDRSVAAEVVSAAPRGAGAAAETYLAVAPAAGFRAGMRIRAWIRGAGEERDGVIVPLSAVVWYAGSPWIYQRQDVDLFVRRRLQGWRNLGDHWFVAGTDLAGLDTVISGAQMILAEELRSQIPDEDDEP